jgi:predicted GNAT family acetyltransferase
MTDFSPLDRPIWNSLTGPHAPLARRAGMAARYPNDVSPLSGLEAETPQAFADLRTLVEANESVALFSAVKPVIPDGWQILRDRAIEQMVCTEVPPHIDVNPLVLGDADVPDMLALTALTEPGPFGPRTHRMGKYIGLRHDEGRLMAMAGQRLSLTGFTEISAVCTDPAFRGRGYSRALIVTLMREVFAAGKIPMLHVKNENGAKILYEKIGFKTRREIQLTVICGGVRRRVKSDRTCNKHRTFRILPRRQRAEHKQCSDREDRENSSTVDCYGERRIGQPLVIRAPEKSQCVPAVGKRQIRE